MKCFGAMLVLGTSALWSWAGPAPTPDSLPDDDAVTRADRARIAAHLQRVEVGLRAADVSHLTARQRARRGEALDHLRDYRRAQAFPHNHAVGSERMPYFEDEHGTLCAMAYLVARSGRTDIVDVVRERFNNGRVVELAADPTIGPVLAAWLEENGMTVAEAQAVQPAYDPPLNPSPSCNGDDCIVAGYAVASAITGAFELTAIAFNAGWLGPNGGRPWAGPFGVVAGAAGMTLGAVNLDKREGALALGWANMGVGALSAALGLRAWLRSPPGGDGAALRRDEPRVRPTVRTTWDGRQELGVRVRF